MGWMTDVFALKTRNWPAAASVLMGFLILAACWLTDLPLYERITALPDGIHRRLPFQDLADILQAGACWRRGVDVYGPSTCLGGGVFNYSPALLWASYLPIGVADRMVGGVVLVMLFAVSLTFLPPPRSAVENLFRLAAVLSPPVLYALEQANFDVVVFFMLSGALVIGRRRPGLSYAILALAAALKFYPVALAGLIFGERGQRFVVLAALLCIGLLSFVVLFGHGTAGAVAVLPFSQPFRATFGAVDLPFGVKILAGSLHPHISAYYPSSALVRAHRLGSILGAFFFIASLWPAYLRAPGYALRVAVLSADERRFLWAGLLVISFCFFAAQNVSYRCIMLLLAVPGLWRLGDGRLIAAVLALLWEAVPRQILAHAAFMPALIGFWMGRECLWWWLIVQFNAIVFAIFLAEWRRLRGEAAGWGQKNLTSGGERPNIT